MDGDEVARGERTVVDHVGDLTEARAAIASSAAGRGDCVDRGGASVDDALDLTVRYGEARADVHLDLFDTETGFQYQGPDVTFSLFCCQREASVHPRFEADKNAKFARIRQLGRPGPVMFTAISLRELAALSLRLEGRRGARRGTRPRRLVWCQGRSPRRSRAPTRACGRCAGRRGGAPPCRGRPAS